MKKAVVLLMMTGLLSAMVAAQSGRTIPNQTNNPSDQSRPRTTEIASPREIPIPNTPENQKTNVEKNSDSDEVLKVETALVTIPVSVIDRKGHFVTTLRQQDFQIFEDGKPQEVAYFAATEQPITVALLIDVSNSTAFKIGELQDAAMTFVKQLKPADKVLVIAFDEKARVLSEATNDRDQLSKAVRRAKFHGGTSLYDAVSFAINQRLRQVAGRKAIVLFTDGVDSTSRKGSFQSTVGDAEEFDATVYTIHYDTYDPEIDDGKPGYGVTRDEYAAGADYVKELADKTGGKLYEADSTRNLENAFFNIAEELRFQYNLGFYPPETGKKGDRKQLKVQVNIKDVAVRARDNYVVGEAGNGKRKIGN